MALNIPMPKIGGDFTSGINAGSNLFARLMQPVMQQQQMNQAQMQHGQTLDMRQQNYDRLAQQFAQQQALAQETEARRRRGLELKEQSQPLDLQLLEAKIKSEQERAKSLEKGGNQRITAAIQEADALYNGDREDPRWSQYVLNKNKQYAPNEKQIAEDEKLRASPEFEKIAPHLENAVDMGHLSAASQQFYRKQMNEELGQIDKAKQVKHAISQARELAKNNPDLYRKAINIIADPDKSPGMIEKALTGFLPKKEVEVFTSAAKLYADILTKQAQLNGMSRSVYALKLQQQAKAQVKNPDETNEQIFKNIISEIDPSLDREKAILYAMKHNQYLPFTKKYGFEEGEPNQVPTAVSSPTSMGMMKGVDAQGLEHDIHPSRREDFIAAGGTIK